MKLWNIQPENWEFLGSEHLFLLLENVQQEQIAPLNHPFDNHKGERDKASLQKLETSGKRSLV